MTLLQVVKPFLEPKTADQVNFVYADDPNTKTIMDNLFYMDELELAFGGENEERFDIKKYADKMKKGDAKRIALNKGYTCSDLSNTLKSNSDIEEKATDTNCVTEVDEEKMSIIMYLDKLTSQEVISLELSTGIPMLYIVKDEKYIRRGSPAAP
nr:sec14p-like phosphatidylinositol transfer family protein [Tanacetum cinerariifolium]